MGKLDKHKIRGIIRTSQTYGKNPDRFVEQNELISDIENTFVSTDYPGLESAMNTVGDNVVLKRAGFGSISNAQLKSAIRANGPASAIKLVNQVFGKTLVPVYASFTCLNPLGGTPESGNRYPSVGWCSVATMNAAPSQGLTGKGPFNDIQADKMYRIVLMQSVLNYRSQFGNANTLEDPNGEAISLWFDAAINGDWAVTGGFVIYYEIDGSIS